MATSSPMDVLRGLAEDTLNETTTQLGQARRVHAMETSRLEQLQEYEGEYRQQLQQTMKAGGVSVLTLQTQQGFIRSLERVVKQQKNQVMHCLQSVEDTLSEWKKDKQRLNAFEALKQRAEVQRQLKENRLEQKLMDEFARRASQRNT